MSDHLFVVTGGPDAGKTGLITEPAVAAARPGRAGFFVSARRIVASLVLDRPSENCSSGRCSKSKPRVPRNSRRFLRLAGNAGRG